MRLSYSSIDLFRICPQKFKFQVIDKIKAPKSKEAFLGEKIHNCLKWLYSKLPSFPTLEEALSYFKNLWNPPEEMFSKKEEELYFSEGIEMLRNYYLKNKSEKPKIFNLETPFLFSLGKDEENQHQISGRIDRIDKIEDGIFEIIDYKTARKMPSQDVINSNLQLPIYYLGFLNKWPSLNVTKINLSFYYLKHNEKFTLSFTKQDIVPIKNRILSLLKEIEVSNYEPKISTLCNWCSYRKICPMWRSMYEKLPSAEEINKLIDEFSILTEINRKNNKRLAEIKTTLNKYLDENKIERIFNDNDYVITRKTMLRYGYDENLVKKILSPLNKWEEILSIDAKKLKNLLKQVPYHIKIEIEQTKKKINEYKTLTLSKIKKMKDSEILENNDES